MQKIREHAEGITLLLIMALATIMRFYGFDSWSLTNDELSAISRLQYGSFSELITHGVRPDFHPAGVQVFLYYWTSLFGNDLWAVRLPFVLCGIASVYYLYMLTKKWFSVPAAQFAAVSLACLTYPILYSQLARPYSPGLLFSLMLAWHWGNILFDDRVRRKDAIGYCIATVLCMYTHYFAFIFAMMAGVTGLFFLKKQNFKQYLIAASVAVLLFLPHIGITVEQFSRGGVGSWLGKPGPDFWSSYLAYAFNESSLVLYAVLALFITSFAINYKAGRFRRGRIISAAWFLIPLLFGYYYSVYRNPILQYSVLLFSFPFLLTFTFSFFSGKGNALTTFSLGAFALLLMYTGVSDQRFYAQKPFGVFKDLYTQKLKWDKKYGKENIQTLYNVISPDYLEYFFKHRDSLDHGKRTYIRGDEPGVLGKVSDLVDASRTYGDIEDEEDQYKEYFVYGWSNIASPPEIYELIKADFPKVVEDHVYFNSRITLFSRDHSYEPRKFLLYTSTDLGLPKRKGWNYDTAKVDQSNSEYYSTYQLRMDQGDEYSGGFEGALSDLTNDTLRYLNVSASIGELPRSNIHLVLEFHRQGNDSLYDWHSAQSSLSRVRDDGNAYTVFLTQRVPDSYHKGDKIKVYVWNPEKKPLRISYIRISSYSDMDYDPKYDLK